MVTFDCCYISILHKVHYNNSTYSGKAWSVQYYFCLVTLYWFDF